MESFAVDTQFILEEGGLDDELQVEWKHHTGIQIISCPPFYFFLFPTKSYFHSSPPPSKYIKFDISAQQLVK